MSEISEIFGDARISAHPLDPITYGDGSLTILGNLFINGGIDFGQGTNNTTGSSFLLLVGDNNQLNLGSKNIVLNGDTNNINGININVFGSTNIVNGESHLVIGSDNSVSGSLNLIIGKAITTSNNNYLFIVGETITSGGDNQLIIGSNLNNNSPNSISMGRSASVNTTGLSGNSIIGRNHSINAPLTENNLMIGQDGSIILPYNNTITLGPDPVLGGQYIGANANTVRPGADNSLTVSAQNGIFLDSGSGYVNTKKITYNSTITKDDITDDRYLSNKDYVIFKGSGLNSYYTRVGQLEQYTTISSAIQAGETNIAVVSDLIETESVTLSLNSKDINIFIGANYIITYEFSDVYLFAYYDPTFLINISFLGPGIINTDINLGGSSLPPYPFIKGFKSILMKNITFNLNHLAVIFNEVSNITTLKFINIDLNYPGITGALVGQHTRVINLGSNSLLENINIYTENNTKLSFFNLINVNNCLFTNIKIFLDDYNNSLPIYYFYIENCSYITLNNIYITSYQTIFGNFHRPQIILISSSNINFYNISGSDQASPIVDYPGMLQIAFKEGINNKCSNITIRESSYFDIINADNNIGTSDIYIDNLKIRECYIYKREPINISIQSGYIKLINNFIFRNDDIVGNTRLTLVVNNTINKVNINIINNNINLDFRIITNSAPNIQIINNIKSYEEFQLFINNVPLDKTIITGNSFLSNGLQLLTTDDDTNFCNKLIMSNNIFSVLILGGTSFSHMVNSIVESNIFNNISAVKFNNPNNGNIFTSNRYMNGIVFSVNPPAVNNDNI